jgi:hypothetical protein
VLAEPTTNEWWMAAVAALLIVLVGGGLFIRPAAATPGTTRSGRIAGWLLACLAAATVLATAVIVGSGIRASMISLDDLRNGAHLPTGHFARYLFDADPDSTERVAQYVPAVLIPAAGTLAVLALAAVDVGRSVGLRLIAGFSCVAVIVVAWYVGKGDVGPLAARSSLGVALLAAAAGIALALDYVLGTPRRPEVPTPPL